MTFRFQSYADFSKYLSDRERAIDAMTAGGITFERVRWFFGGKYHHEVRVYEVNWIGGTPLLNAREILKEAEIIQEINWDLERNARNEDFADFVSKKYSVRIDEKAEVEAGQ